MSDIETSLDCGCHVSIREEWEYGCAGDCCPGYYTHGGGELTHPCDKHSAGDDVEALKDRIADLEDQVEQQLHELAEWRNL